MDGTGKLTNVHGVICEGGWLLGNMNGIENFTHADDNSYQGTCLDGKKHG